MYLNAPPVKGSRVYILTLLVGTIKNVMGGVEEPDIPFLIVAPVPVVPRRSLTCRYCHSFLLYPLTIYNHERKTEGKIEVN